MNASTQLRAAVVDAASMWDGFSNWAAISTPEMRMAWSVTSMPELRMMRDRADVLFITTNERRGENLGYMILTGLRYAKQVVIAARYYSEDLVREVKARGAAGAVRANTAWTSIFKEAFTVLGINQTPSKALGPNGKPLILTPEEVEALRLYKQGFPLLLIGSDVGKSGQWVIDLLVREGLRKPAPTTASSPSRNAGRSTAPVRTYGRR